MSAISGTFSDKSFPEVLWTCFEAKSTGMLRLQKGQVEKRIFFDAGFPMQADSNLLHETILAQLHLEGRIQESQMQSLLSAAQANGQAIEQYLVTQKIVAASELAQLLKKNLAEKILDCFSWEKGAFQFIENDSFLGEMLGFRVNPLKLIFKGCRNFLPASFVQKPFFSGQGHYKFNSSVAIAEKDLRLAGEEAKLLQAFKQAQSFDEICSHSSLDIEMIKRVVFSFMLLDLIKPGSKEGELSLDELVGQTLLAALTKEKSSKPGSASNEADKQAFIEKLMAKHLEMKSSNYYEFFDLDLSSKAVAIRDAFVAFSKEYSPAFIDLYGLDENAFTVEEVFLHGVEVFGVLGELHSREKYRDKLKADLKNQSKEKKIPGLAFKIQTKLLDASSQFKEGVAFMKEGALAKALEQFEYAVEIDGKKPEYWAYLGWTTFNVAPDRNGPKALEILTKARKMKPENAMAAYYLGKYYIDAADIKQGIMHLRKANALAPKNQSILRDLQKAKALS